MLHIICKDIDITWKKKRVQRQRWNKAARAWPPASSVPIASFMSWAGEAVSSFISMSFDSFSSMTTLPTRPSRTPPPPPPPPSVRTAASNGHSHHHDSLPPPSYSLPSPNTRKKVSEKCHSRRRAGSIAMESLPSIEENHVDSLQMGPIRIMSYDDRNHWAVLTQLYGSVWPHVLPFCIVNMILTLLVFYFLRDYTFDKSGHQFMRYGFERQVYFLCKNAKLYTSMNGSECI